VLSYHLDVGSRWKVFLYDVPLPFVQHYGFEHDRLPGNSLFTFPVGLRDCLLTSSELYLPYVL
jgi:hypothetical protein